jgi:hypothetical protein
MLSGKTSIFVVFMTSFRGENQRGFLLGRVTGAMLRTRSGVKINVDFYWEG